MRRCIHYPLRRCSNKSCSLIDVMGNVSCCSVHPNPGGYFMRRRVGVILRSIFDKHCRGR
jgi:hypothetical protein